MAVIAPSRSFDGSDLSTNVFGKVIKDGVRTVNFREDKNKEGNFFFILPPYKADAMGRGVSWKVVSIRDNFGIDVKETFAVPQRCPIAYFSGRVKQFYPDYAKVEQIQQAGRTVKRYPPFGRLTNKVLFNVAYMSALQLGAHVLTLPQFGGGEHIEAWHRRRMPDGSEAPLLNNPEAAIPVFIQLKKDAVGQPWVVTPEASKTYKLPVELADASFLYNLDEVVHYPEIDYLLDKLQSFVPTEIFNRCMQGYQLPNGHVIGAASAVSGVALPSASAVPVPSVGIPTAGIPTANIPGTGLNPSAGLPTAVAQPMPIVGGSIPKAVVPSMPISAPVEAPVPQVTAPSLSNPMAAAPASGGYSIEEARKFLAQGR
ncbi:hypothetical protein EKK58_01115 [Candidatus Dependentiae bacterium]|nr:MAG: hypothetical protein EKK58_01115 [Candidatus Dependentiae bacterium]